MEYRVYRIADRQLAPWRPGAVAQDGCSAHHKQYSLLIADRLASSLRADATVQRLIAQWRLLADERVLSVLKRGSA